MKTRGKVNDEAPAVQIPSAPPSALDHHDDDPPLPTPLAPESAANNEEPEQPDYDGVIAHRDAKNRRKPPYQWDWGGVAAHRARNLLIFKKAKEVKVFHRKNVKALKVPTVEDPTKTETVKTKDQKWDYIAKSLNRACATAKFDDPAPAKGNTVQKKVQAVVKEYEEWRKQSPTGIINSAMEDQSSTGGLTATVAIARNATTPDILDDDAVIETVQAYLQEVKEYEDDIEVSVPVI